MAIYKKIEERKDLCRYIIVASSDTEDSLHKSFVDTRVFECSQIEFFQYSQVTNFVELSF